MRKIFVLFQLILCFTVFSQTNEKRVIVLDEDTNQPIEAAVVFVLKTKQVLVTNIEGTVAFEIKGGSNLKVTHPSYSPLVIKWASLTQSENIFYLKSNPNTLDNIVIISKKPSEIIQDL